MKGRMKLYLFLAFVAFCGCQQKATNNQIDVVTSETALQMLMDGNKRFSMLKPVHPHESIEQLRDVAHGQHPFAVVVCCSDSRVSPELIFDEGIGDLFVIRTAGNVIGGLEIGSIEYAVEHLSVKQVVIMGHEGCGAIEAFTEGGEIPGHIKDIIDSIRQEVEIKTIPLNTTNRVDEYVKANVQHGIRQLTLQSKIINEKVKNGLVQITGLRYDLDDLSVTILKQ